MDDSELTRKAIQELLENMNDFKGSDTLKRERKKNPLGRPNKRFLGRTINSMLTHNKRQNDRNHQICQRKLRDLDAKQRKRQFRNQHKDLRRYSKWDSSHEVISGDDSADNVQMNKKIKKIKKKKKKRRKKKQQSSSSSSSMSSSSRTSSSSDTDSSSSSNSSVKSKDEYRRKKRHEKHSKVENCEQDYYNDYCDDMDVGYYVYPNVAYAAMAYNQMNHTLQQQQIVEQQMVKEVKEDLEESVEIPSDLSLSDNSESSLNISLNSSSAEEDENGILTFKLSSEDEAKPCKNNGNIKQQTKESDNESVKSHISLESESSQKETLKVASEICVLSSSPSDSEDIEIIEDVVEATNEDLESEISEQEVKITNNVNDMECKDETTSLIANDNVETDKIDLRLKSSGENDKSVPENVEANEKEINISTMVDLTDN